MLNEFQGYESDTESVSDANKVKSKDPDLQSYIGCKIIQARPMTQELWLRSQGKWQENQETYGDGYLVIYDDGYHSWSPKDVFERCYRIITDREKTLIK